jgi:hypothetical protein
MTSNDEAAHAASEVHAASETNLNIPLVSSQGAGDAVGLNLLAKATRLRSSTAAQTPQITLKVSAARSAIVAGELGPRCRGDAGAPNCPAERLPCAADPYAACTSARRWPDERGLPIRAQGGFRLYKRNCLARLALSHANRSSPPSRARAAT